uniref:SCP domain-containing protein n=1 Tax=Ascaris lumbricoides TaxID=6252 RepID=A0A0M3HZ18_ASCLU
MRCSCQSSAYHSEKSLDPRKVNAGVILAREFDQTLLTGYANVEQALTMNTSSTK